MVFKFSHFSLFYLVSYNSSLCSLCSNYIGLAIPTDGQVLYTVIPSTSNVVLPGVHFAHSFISIRSLMQTFPLREDYYAHSFFTINPYPCILNCL